jgi:catechol 2,3-dioxygenase-like lactoylglutathione lyase family enzyme
MLMAASSSPASPAAKSAAAHKASPIGYNGGLTCVYQVSDIKRSLDWYQNVLGFKLIYHVEEMGWAELASEVNGVNVGLSQVEQPNVGLCAKLTWGVKDIDLARQFVESKKVRFDGPTQEIPGMVKLATFFDPDGNPMMFYQDLQGARGA